MESQQIIRETKHFHLNMHCTATILGLLLVYPLNSYGSIEAETLHLEDAERVEEYLIDQGIPSEMFIISILSIDTTTNYVLQWPDIKLSPEEGEIMQYIGVQMASVEAVANAIRISKWDSDYLLLLYDDGFSAMESSSVQEYLNILTNANAMDPLTFISMHTQYYISEANQGADTAKTLPPPNSD